MDFARTMIRAMFPGELSAWKTENGILTLPWPSPSQDLNIIENFWKVIKITLQSELLKSKPNQI
jgi:hypothetical protein